MAYGMRYRRKRGMMRRRGRRVTKRRMIVHRQEQYGQQHTTRGLRTGRRLRAAAQRRRLIAASKQHAVTRFAGIKEFVNYGAYWAGNSVSGTVNTLPVYALLLNARTSAGVACTPLLRLKIGNTGATDGKLFWESMSGVDQTGAANPNLTTEYEDVTGSTFLNAKNMWDWTDLKMNLWGAKSRAITWEIDIVKVTEQSANPWYGAGTIMTTEGQQAWLPWVKQYVYNPLAKMNLGANPLVKVIKSFKKELQPDFAVGTNPHVHTFKWFSRWNRIVSYDDSVSTAVGATQLNNDTALYTTEEPLSIRNRTWQPYPNSEEMVFAVIRATAFDHNPAGGEVNNQLFGSFDVIMRSKFTGLG